ncbi:MAG: hypothetical protein QM621_09465 [Aeromicrobium sp.]|uniref:hypothetical protein n=1 Tax=Aeromicrobium sp. TaxID=1871063 RepID=UPI0039E5875C
METLRRPRSSHLRLLRHDRDPLQQQILALIEREEAIAYAHDVARTLRTRRAKARRARTVWRLPDKR